MGYALAEEAVAAGAEVILVSGPVALDPPHPAVRLIRVETAGEMLAACREHFPSCDAAIMAAAVADYTSREYSRQKIRKEGDELALYLKRTTDIAAELGRMKQPGQILAGFALETEHEQENARGKLVRKNLDLVVLNSLNDPGAGFGTDTNKVTIIGRDNNTLEFGLKDKRKVAHDIIETIQEYFQRV